MKSSCFRGILDNLVYKELKEKVTFSQVECRKVTNEDENYCQENVHKMGVYRNDSYRVYDRQVCRCDDGPSYGSCHGTNHVVDDAMM